MIAGKKIKASGVTITGKIQLANCIVVGAGALACTLITRQYADMPAFILASIFLAGGLILGLTTNYLAVKAALRPLNRLALAMDEVHDGNLEIRAEPVDADPEIARLTHNFNTMLDWINHDRRAIEELSLVDPLTEVGNTRALNKSLEQEIARIERYGQIMPAVFSVLIVDLDRFREINDTFGHMTGDKILRDTAGLLQSSLRQCDTALAALKHFRFGGDEFVIVAPHTGSEGACILCDRLVTHIAEHEFSTHSGIPMHQTGFGKVTASVGYASYPEETTKAQELLDLADRRMYQRKNIRRNGKRIDPSPGSGMWELGDTDTLHA